MKRNLLPNSSLSILSKLDPKTEKKKSAENIVVNSKIIIRNIQNRLDSIAKE